MLNKFQIYGERCSGTNLVNALISGSSFYHNGRTPVFPNLKPTSEFGHKHWIGHKTKQILEEGSDTLFIGIVRHPYDWIISFFRKKHHLPPPLRNFNGFLHHEWYSVGNGQEIPMDRFWKTGDRFVNIFELREEKLKYLYYVMPKIAPNYIFIKYEDLCANLSSFINQVSLKTGHEPQKTDIHIKLSTYPFDMRIAKAVNSGIAWDIENAVGYKKKFIPPS